MCVCGGGGSGGVIVKKSLVKLVTLHVVFIFRWQLDESPR